MSDESTPRKAARPPSAYRVEIIRRRCTGVGTCMEVAPRTFDLDDDAVAYVRKPNGDDDAKILEAARACPKDAIVIYDATTGDKLYPK
jgi:ferredoxin